MMKRRHVSWIFGILALVLLLGICGRAEAASETIHLLTITAKSSLQKASQKVTADGSGGWYSMEYTPIDIAVKSPSEKVNVTVEVKSNLVDKASLSFTEMSGTQEELSSAGFTFKYSYQEGGWSTTRTLSRLINVHYAKVTVKAPKVKTVKAGFHPGKGNALPVSAVIQVQERSAEMALKCRLRILNSKGKYVFQKVFDVPSANVSTLLFSYQWNGKSSKGNAAKVTAGKYVSRGKYKAEISVYAAGSTDGGKKAAAEIPVVSKKTAFTVSTGAPTGASALKAAQGEVLVYTGYPQIDYMAEQMVKKAGVTLSMSDDAKVQRIYHYMTQNFTHIKAWTDTSKYKVYYNLDKLKSKIDTYYSGVYKKWIKGNIVFDNSMSFYDTPYNMARQMGVCTDNALCFKILLAHVGVQSGLCDGYYLNRNGTKAGHTWNWVLVDGTKYYYDVDVEIINYGNGQGDYYWYKKSLASSKNTHEYLSTEKSKSVTIPTWQGW